MDDLSGAQPFKVVPLPGKGYGIVATEDIRPGTIIYQEGPVMRIAKKAQTLTEEDVSTAFAKLQPSQQQVVLDMSEDKKFERSKLMGIFKSNSFGDDVSCWLHPVVCRINHSCTPNAVTASDPCCIGDDVQVFAEKHIKTGDEITISYNHQLYEITTARQRAVLLQRQYGFACDCPNCQQGTESSALSDKRRLLIKELRSSLSGLRTSDFRILDNAEPTSHAAKAIPERALWVKEDQALKANLSPDRRAAYFLLQAKLREAEGLPTLDIAMNYWQAAEAMLQQITDMQTIVVLNWAKSVRDLMKRAINTMDTVRSPYDHDPQFLREAWKAIKERPCMMIGLGYLDGDVSIPKTKKRHADRKTFAVQVVSGQLRELSRREFRDAISQKNAAPSSTKVHAPSQPTTTNREGNTWYNNLGHKIGDTRTLYKVVGAALSMAAPLVAWLVMR